MANGDLSDHDGFGKSGRLVLTSSSRAWDSRFQPDRLLMFFKREGRRAISEGFGACYFFPCSAP